MHLNLNIFDQVQEYFMPGRVSGVCAIVSNQPAKADAMRAQNGNIIFVLELICHESDFIEWYENGFALRK